MPSKPPIKSQPAPPAARPLSAEQFFYRRAWDKTIPDAMEAYAAHVCQPLVEALERISSEDTDCGCDCGNDPECCMKQGVYCAKCVAEAALETFRKGRE